MGIETSPDLRLMVREVLREALAGRAGTLAGRQAVRIGSDADLQAFIVRLSVPGAIEAVRAGGLTFALSAPATPAPAAVQTNAAVRPQALDGVVSERKLQGLVAGSTVKLTSKAVLTPLAKDVARRNGLNFERIG